MKHPEIAVKNHVAVYDYFESRQSNACLATAAVRFSGAIWHPRVVYQDDAHSEITTALKTGTQLLLASNHVTMFDQFPIASALRKEAMFTPVLQNIFIPAKAPHFKRKAASTLLAAVGAVPVFRPQDVNGTEEEFVGSTRSFIHMATQKLNAGQHMLIFPEGTRNKNDPSQLGSINGGIARIATGVSEETKVAIVPIGLWYGRTVMQPDVVVGAPIMGPFAKRQEVMSPLRSAMTECVRLAIANHHTWFNELQTPEVRSTR